MYGFYSATNEHKMDSCASHYHLLCSDKAYPNLSNYNYTVI